MRVRFVALIAAALVAAVPAPAAAGAKDFILINGTGKAMRSLSIRPFRSGAWRPLAGSPGLQGRVAVPFKNDDCAFDIQASFAASKPVIWPGVNLCEVTAVILHWDGSGAAWVDYN